MAGLRSVLRILPSLMLLSMSASHHQSDHDQCMLVRLPYNVSPSMAPNTTTTTTVNSTTNITTMYPVEPLLSSGNIHAFDETFRELSLYLNVSKLTAPETLPDDYTNFVKDKEVANCGSFNDPMASHSTMPWDMFFYIGFRKPTRVCAASILTNNIAIVSNKCATKGITTLSQLWGELRYQEAQNDYKFDLAFSRIGTTMITNAEFSSSPMGSRGESNKGDTAIIYTAQNLTSFGNERTPTLCMPTKDDIFPVGPESECSMSILQKFKLEVNVTILEDAECRRLTGQDIDAQWMCVVLKTESGDKNPYEYVDTCSLLKTINPHVACKLNGKYHLAGIASFGFPKDDEDEGCMTTSWPWAFSKVNVQEIWIKSAIRNMLAGAADLSSITRIGLSNPHWEADNKPINP